MLFEENNYMVEEGKYAPDSFEEAVKLHTNTEGAFSMRSDKLFVLLLGPSSVGKSTIICGLDNALFTYISPYITRPLREEERDKIVIGDDEFNSLAQDGMFIYINHLYGVRYGTPLMPIQETLAQGRIPILDFPLQQVSVLQRPEEYDLLNVYVFPETMQQWVNQVGQTGRNQDGRMEAGIDR